MMCLVALRIFRSFPALGLALGLFVSAGPRAELPNAESTAQVRDLLHHIRQRFPADRYFLVGVGGSPKVLVDGANRLNPESAVIVPFSDARSLMESPDYLELWNGSRHKPQRQAAIARTALTPRARAALEQHIVDTLGNKVRGRILLTFDISVEGYSLMLFTETLKAAHPEWPIEALALDGRGDFEIPDNTYHRINLADSRFSQVESALLRLKIYSGVPRWTPELGLVSRSTSLWRPSYEAYLDALVPARLSPATTAPQDFSPRSTANPCPRYFRAARAH